MTFIGVDLHTNNFTACRLEADGREEFATYQLAAADLERFCFGLDGNDEVAVEATGNSTWLCGESLTGALAEIDAAIEAAAKKLDGYDGVVSIKGIVPKVSQSNDTDHRGRIAKRGNRLMRTTLVQCTLIAIRCSGYLNSFYRRIKERRGAGKAIIATSCKLLTIIYDTLRNGWVFQDVPAFKIAEKTT